MTPWTAPRSALVAPVLSIFITPAAVAQTETPGSISANDHALISIDDAAEDVPASVGPMIPAESDDADAQDNPNQRSATSALAEDDAESGDANARRAAESPKSASTASVESREGDPASEDDGASAAPARESRGLGVPNGLFSARPVDETDERTTPGADVEAGATGSMLSTIDPRSNPVIRVVVSLGAVLGLLFLFKVLMTRGAGLLQGGRPSGVIEILGRYPLGRKQSLVLLKLARRVILLHQNGAQMTTLSEVSEPHEVAALLSRVEAGSTGKQAQRFRSILKRFESEHATKHASGQRDDLFPAVNGHGAAGEVVDLTKRSRRAQHGLGKRRLRA